MVKYEDLERQLLDAKSQAEQADEEEQLARAAAAVARLTAPDDPTFMSSVDEASINRWPMGVMQRGGGIGSTAGSTSSSDRNALSRASISSAPWTSNGYGSDSESSHEKVRALEEKMSEVMEHVNLGDSLESADEGAVANKVIDASSHS